MPYPVHAVKMGDIYCRDILQIGYFAYHVSFHRGGTPSLQKYWIEPGGLFRSVYTDNLFIKIRYLTDDGNFHPYEMDFSVVDHNIVVNNYNDHVLFLDWHHAVDYYFRCWMRGRESGGMRAYNVARNIQPEDGKEYEIHGYLFLPKFKPEQVTLQSEPRGESIGDILRYAIRRRQMTEAESYKFGGKKPRW